MGIHAALTHRTSYRYDRPVRLGPQVIRLRPAPHARTEILSYSLKVSPEEHFLNWQQDPFGNWMARLVFSEPTDHFEVTVDLVADMASINPFDFFLIESAEHAPFTYAADLKKELAPYLEPIDGGAKLAVLEAEARKLLDRKEDYRTVDFLVDVNQSIKDRVAYTIRLEPGVQTPEETLEKALGSCRDSAWLLVALMRRLGYAARFVSGYLLQLTADQRALDGTVDGPEADFTDLHAWAEIYAPGAGWIGLDPTSGLFASEGHIPLAATAAPQAAAPIHGGLAPVDASNPEPLKDTFDFEMSVRRIYERPRVTAPIDDESWQDLLAAGDVVDKKLTEGDVRLTMGGEPTFISGIDRDADEWNTDAVGPTKRGYADKLIRRLRTRFAPGGLLQYGQGKWYPGEQLPRWAFALYWRKDGLPLWGDPELIAAETGPRGATIKHANQLTEAIAARLGVAPDCARPVFEDPAEFMLKERKLAPNLDPKHNKLDDPEERRRMTRVFDRGLETPVGYVLPIQAAQAPASSPAQAELLKRRRRFAWKSEVWRTRRERIFLMPGDSPVGFRLPLRSLAHIDEDLYPHVLEQDPTARRGALPRRSIELQNRARELATIDAMRLATPAGRAPVAPPPPLTDDIDPDLLPLFEEIDWLPMADIAPGGALIAGGPQVRTALAVEPRDGVLSVFLPPVSSADEYVDLIHAVEEAATDIGMPINVEGYPPPSDPRLEMVKITPDPGVLEINVQPAASWREQVEISEILYEEARQIGLEASKFMTDGRPTGSGGGAHVVVGGATPNDSPFLRRPDLLASMVRYWQNHPSLSYFFSGMFIGPTSQAPRIDEARHDSLYELEIALEQIPLPQDLANGAQSVPNWLVDRIFRHLLVDVTGNTHRAEICIDKMFSPDGPTGRLGLVELRALEMPPHARMNLAQQLVIRGLIAMFWDKPYTRPFTRFGAALHDRYMLPHYVWRDFEEVLSDLTHGLGVTFDPGWFRSQFEFRFPRIGAIQTCDLEVEIRSAIEPWHVLGEEGAVGGTARFVDSSLERLQVSVSGDLQNRYVVTCNTLRMPLRGVGAGGSTAPSETVSDLRVGGVRFRTWLPPSALHPTIPAHGPLVFDVVDTWNGRSLGGCTYYVEHPGGRNSDLQPVNALEAESRRKSRFEAFGHTPGPFTIAEPSLSPETPYTLDLRRQKPR